MSVAWVRIVLCEGRNVGWWVDVRLFFSDDCSFVFIIFRGYVVIVFVVFFVLNINKYKIFDKVDFIYESKSFDIKILNIFF